MKACFGRNEKSIAPPPINGSWYEENWLISSLPLKRLTNHRLPPAHLKNGLICNYSFLLIAMNMIAFLYGRMIISSLCYLPMPSFITSYIHDEIHVIENVKIAYDTLEYKFI